MVLGPLFRTLQTFLGYVCPAYYTYKTIESKKTEAMLDWAMYWFVLALFSTVERLLDVFFFWLPFYSLGKVFLVVYLWYPGTKGAQVVYNRFVRVHLGKHEPKIDGIVNDAKNWALELYHHYRDTAIEIVKTYGFGALMKVQAASMKASAAAMEEEPKKEG